MAAIKLFYPVLFVFIFWFGGVDAAMARTTLVSLPSRQHVALRLGENGKTLVQEKRILLLKKGINTIDFSWQNVMIDPGSIILNTLSHPDKINILNISYPPNEAALVWEISSLEDLEEEVMISYLLAGIDGISTYTAVTDKTEQTIDLKSYLVLRNFSGERFDTVTAHDAVGNRFITSIQNLETKQILVSEQHAVPITKRYTWDASTMPHDPEKTALTVGLPTRYEFIAQFMQGKTRLFQKDSQGSTVFIGEDTASFTPKGEKASLYIGDSRDIVVTQKRLDTQRIGIRRDVKGHIQVYDEIIKNEVIMENLKDRPMTLSLIETIPGQWEPVNISMEYRLKDYKTLEFSVHLSAKEKKTLVMQYKILNIFDQNFSQYNQVQY